MQVIKVSNPAEGAQEAFKIIENSLKNNELKVFGLATGSTPVPLYNLLKSSTLDFSDKTSINLDEYVGLGAEDKQSYRYFMNEQLFNKKPFKKSYIPNGMATDAIAECQRYDRVIEEHPIDIQILGLGQNGHIGFNEPGTPFDSVTHKVALTGSTIEANKRFFEKVEDVPTHAYSMGIASILKGKKIIIMAYGESKAEAVKAMLEGPITENLPASALQNHSDVTVIIDEAAAGLL